MTQLASSLGFRSPFCAPVLPSPRGCQKETYKQAQSTAPLWYWRPRPSRCGLCDVLLLSLTPLPHPPGHPCLLSSPTSLPVPPPGHWVSGVWAYLLSDILFAWVLGSLAFPVFKEVLPDHSTHPTHAPSRYHICLLQSSYPFCRTPHYPNQDVSSKVQKHFPTHLSCVPEPGPEPRGCSRNIC